jgi:hypothetical protein
MDYNILTEVAMPEISLTNSKKRDAQVQASSVKVPLKVRWLDGEDRQVQSARILKGTMSHDLNALTKQFGTAEAITQAMIDGDPEIDLESTGQFLRDTSRAYVNGTGEIVHRVVEMEIVRTPTGEEKARRPKKQSQPNMTADQPLLWSGKLFSKDEVARKFVMTSKMQLLHVNGLTFDFLYEIAKELEAKKSVLLMGAGPKSNQPLILRRGSVPYRGFLEGRTKGDQYCLLLHLSNMELKTPEPKSTSEEGAAS